MHELSLAQDIVKVLQQHLPSGEGRRVRSVKLKVGALVGVTPDSLAFCFKLASEGTPAQGAELHIESVPIVCRCDKCGSGFEAGRYVTICPNCKDPNVKLLSGDELDVIELELG